MQDGDFSTRPSERRTWFRRSSALWRLPILRWRVSGFLAAAFWIISFLALAAESHAESVSEYQVKALFLYNFAKFVDWPPSAFASPKAPFAVCVVGEDPFGSELDQAVRGKSINGRKLISKRVFRAQDIRSCQIAFISFPDEKRVRQVLEEANSSSVLTVGGINGFTEWGGVVNLTVVSNKVRFEINADAAERCRLRISSKLLSLAKAVIRRGRS